jgi:hypothetical protein
MPKMTYIKGVGYVRAGSWSTKPAVEKWRLTEQQLKSASHVMVRRLSHLLFEEGSEYSQAAKDAYEDTIVWELEHLARQIDSLLKKFPKERRAKALEQVTGRTPEEAAEFLAKAKEIRDSM